MYLLQGVFFQGRTGFGIAFDPEMAGLRATVETIPMAPYLYGGAFWRDPEGDALVGQMHDDFGRSCIREIEIDPDHGRLSFIKVYERRHDQIEYTFDRRDGAGTLFGTYNGMHAGTGLTWARLITVPVSYLDFSWVADVLSADPNKF